MGSDRRSKIHYPLLMSDYLPCTEEAMDYLSKADPELGRIIEQIGPIKRPADPDLFSSVVRHIIGQQISIAAQATIWQRMGEAFDSLTPAAVQASTVDELQSFGMTFRKAEYIHNIAIKIEEGSLDLERLQTLEDDEVTKELVKLKGIGPWTAEMILLFGLKRPDVLSYGDLAILRGIRILYNLESIDRPTFEMYRRRYSPYGTTASLYLWAVSKTKAL
jgi:DNA-3-methyladenine glycosylase II